MKDKKIILFIVSVAVVILLLVFVELPYNQEPQNSGWTSMWGATNCDNSGPTMLNVSPLAIENLWFIQPMGNVGGSHVLPTDHQYWHMVNGTTSDSQNFEIRAPADGNITYIGQISQWHTDFPEWMEGAYHTDYNIAIEYSCDLSTYMIHIDKLRDDIVEQLNFGEENDGFKDCNVFIPLKEGEVFAWVSGGKFDFSVHNASITLPGFIYPEHYFDYDHKMHAMDPFDYFNEPVRSQIIDKCIRKVEPYGGKIDYDIEGRLIGSWFKENTNWHKGLTLERYWDGHFVFCYDYVFPNQLRISMGDYDGKTAQFTVKNGSIDPADVSIGSGFVKYEYLSYQSLMISERGLIEDPFSENFTEDLSKGYDEDVRGVMLFQILENNKMKMEVFPGSIASEVTAFTDNFRIYER